MSYPPLPSYYSMVQPHNYMSLSSSVPHAAGRGTCLPHAAAKATGSATPAAVCPPRAAGRGRGGGWGGLPIPARFANELPYPVAQLPPAPFAAPITKPTPSGCSANGGRGSLAAPTSARCRSRSRSHTPPPGIRARARSRSPRRSNHRNERSRRLMMPHRSVLVSPEHRLISSSSGLRTRARSRSHGRMRTTSTMIDAHTSSNLDLSCRSTTHSQPPISRSQLNISRPTKPTGVT